MDKYVDTITEASKEAYEKLTVSDVLGCIARLRNGKCGWIVRGQSPDYLPIIGDEYYCNIRYATDGHLQYIGHTDDYEIMEILACTIHNVSCRSSHTPAIMTNLQLCDSPNLIWTREESMTKKMTVAEICAALGYDVEIVKEK